MQIAANNNDNDGYDSANIDDLFKAGRLWHSIMEEYSQ